MTRVCSREIDNLFQIMIRAEVGQQMSADLGTWSTRNASRIRFTVDLGHSYLSDPR